MSNSNDAGQTRLPDRRRGLWIADEDLSAARRLLELFDDSSILSEAGGSSGRRVALDRARSAHSLRQRRVDILGNEFSAEPPFALLLALYVIEEREPATTPTRLNYLASLSLTTALRWLE